MPLLGASVPIFATSVFWPSALVLAAALLAIDLLLPLGSAGGMLYILLVLFSGASRSRRAVLIVTVAASVMIGLGFLLKADMAAPIWVASTNRLVAGALCWAAAGYVVLALADAGPAGSASSRGRLGQIVLAALAIGFLVVLIASLAAARLSIARNENALQVEHAFAVQRAFAALASTARDAESGQRGYLLTEDLSYLRPFREAEARMDPVVSRLREITAGSDEQSRLAERAVALARAKFQEVRTTVQYAQTGRRDQAVILVASDVGAQVMAELRQTVSQATMRTERLLGQQIAEQQRTGATLLAVQAGGTALLLLVASAAMFVSWRDNRSLAQARDLLSDANVTLEGRVAERTTELARLTETLAGQAAQTRLALEAGNVGTWSYTFSDRALFCDAKCRDAYGFPEADRLDFRDMAGRVHPEDRPALRRLMREALRPGSDGHLVAEYRVMRGDETRWVVAHGQTTFAQSGGRTWPTRLSGTVVDVTERKKAEDGQSLLLRELAHRVKNVLAVVQSMAALSARAHPEAEAFMEAFKGRLAALALAHTLLIGSERQAAQFNVLVRDTLRPFLDAEGQRIRIDIPDVTLRASEAQTMALLLHELATNAAKYGALSNDTGQVNVTSRLDRERDEDGRMVSMLRVEWRETGGPPVKAPERRGFGMTLLERAVRMQHGGKTEIAWHPDGLHAVVRLPLITATVGRRSRADALSPKDAAAE